MKSQVGVLFIDIDGFKPVNDTLGHDVGDLLLQQISERLSNSVRETDTVARVGGDEFVIVLENLSGNPLDETTIISIAKKILNTIQKPFNLSARKCSIGSSIGISVFPNDSQDELLKQSDTAMYVAKGAGKNRIVFYHDTMTKK